MKTISLIARICAFLIILASCTSNEEKDESNLYRIRVGEKYGFIDKHGKVIIEPQYDYAVDDCFIDGVYYVEVGEKCDKKYIIDKNGDIKADVSEILKLRESIFFISGGLACFGNRGVREGIMDVNGSVIIPAKDNADVYIDKDGENVYIIVRENGDNCYITDRLGNQIGQKYDEVYGFKQGLCAVKMNGKGGYIDTLGNMVINDTFDYVNSFTADGLASVRKDKEEFFIDKQGKCVIRVDEIINKFSCNRAAVILNGEKCLIDKTGKKICKLECDDIYDFSTDNLATIFKNHKASIIDTMGNVILNTPYYYISNFHNGVAYCRSNGKWGAINISGKEIVPCIYEHRSFFIDDNLLIFDNYINGNFCYSYFDHEGNLLWQDVPPVEKISCPYSGNRNDFIKYYDANIANLDPIEGIYYVTDKNYYQDRDNLNQIGLNKSESQFYAIAKEDPKKDEFTVFFLDRGNYAWVNKFVKLGDSNNYAIVKSNKKSNYSSEGRVTIEDFNSFGFRLEQGDNNYYNFFVTYEFVRDYPSVKEYEQYQRAEWTGSGFAIADGIIATNCHVTNGAKSIRVKGVNGDMEKSYKGFVMASDKEHDLSIIKIVDAGFDGFGTIPYKVSRKGVDTGDDIFVLGYPLISSMGNEVKLTDGKISSKSGFKGDESLYQISAAVQHGNSGGPVFDSEGNVVGIVRGKHADAENANYAIKVSYLYNMLETSGCKIKVADKNTLNTSKMSSMVKEIKNFVYLIECNSK